MGLCKCPKRRVTNQFCFEHRVCVCENCMVTNHPICIVQSYLQWLQDSDYNSICELCSKELNLEDSIRLTCYHVFHWSCLDHYARQLSPTTAPRGYTCPSCKSPLFPPPFLVSPVADVLREKLIGVNWARAGLGLPLLSEERMVKAAVQNSVSSTPRRTPSPSHSVVDVEEQHTTASNRNLSDNFQGWSNRRAGLDARVTKATYFEDEDKYKRKPITELLNNWYKITYGPSLRTRGKSLFYRRCLIVVYFLLAVILFLYIMSKLGSYSTDNDPMFNENNNPLVHVEQKN